MRPGLLGSLMQVFSETRELAQGGVTSSKRKPDLGSLTGETSQTKHRRTVMFQLHDVKVQQQSD